jgi:hypothetical protein
MLKKIHLLLKKYKFELGVKCLIRNASLTKKHTMLD